jgi:5-methylcytosine-specific restriction endonuclease McrA
MVINERQWLQRFAKHVHGELDSSPGALLRLVKVDRLLAEESWTGGWFVTLGTVEGTKGSLQVWLDRTTRKATRELSACYYVWDDAAMDALEAAAPKGLVPARRLTLDDWSSSDDVLWQLRKPMPAALYRATISERYAPEWPNYLSRYWPGQVGSPAGSDSALARHVGEFLGVLTAALSAISADSSDRPYPATENRRRVALHLKRDRSAGLAKKRKIHDLYRCQVCGFESAVFYGAAGRGVAEVHHRASLASLEGQQKTVLSDLITVCANCHRVLHRMSGKASDVAKLQKIVRERARADS